MQVWYVCRRRRKKKKTESKRVPSSNECVRVVSRRGRDETKEKEKGKGKEMERKGGGGNDGCDADGAMYVAAARAAGKAGTDSLYRSPPHRPPVDYTCIISRY